MYQVGRKKNHAQQEKKIERDKKNVCISVCLYINTSTVNITGSVRGGDLCHRQHPCGIKGPTFSTVPRPASSPSGIHPVSVGRRCSRPFWRICSWHAPRQNQRGDLMSMRPACHRLPVGKNTQ